MSEQLVNYIEIGKPSDYHKLNNPNLVEINSIDFLHNIFHEKTWFQDQFSNYQYILEVYKKTLIYFNNEKNENTSFNDIDDISNLPGNSEIHSIIRFRASQETNLKFARCHQALSGFKNDANITRVKFDTTEYREVRGEHYLHENEVSKLSEFFTKCFNSNFPYLTSRYNDKVFPEIYFILFKYTLNNEVFYFEVEFGERLDFCGSIEYRGYGGFTWETPEVYFLKFKSNCDTDTDTDKSIEECIAKAEEYTKKLISKNKIRNMVWQFQLTVGFILRCILFGGFVFPAVMMLICSLIYSLIFE